VSAPPVFVGLPSYKENARRRNNGGDHRVHEDKAAATMPRPSFANGDRHESRREGNQARRYMKREG